MTSRRTPYAAALGLALSFAATSLAPPPRAATLPAELGTRGMVAADHPLASRAGLELLRQGGNAVDAACATVFALGVVNPAGSGLGGGGFLMVHVPGEAAPRILDFRETAPGKAHRAMFLGAGVPRAASQRGGLAVAVPGEVRGCAEALRRYGKLPLAKVLAPALRLARGGFPVGRHLAAATLHLGPALSTSEELKREFLSQSRPLRPGELLRRPLLAQTLALLAQQGPDAFYRGRIGRDLLERVAASGGILGAEDLASYKVVERAPLRVTYRGHEVFTMPPPSSGGVALVQVLGMLGRRPLAPLGHNSSRYLHRVAEALKHAFADRARFLGDTDFVKVPVERLTSPALAAELERRLGERVLAPNRYGSAPSPVAPPSDGGTSHVSVIDGRGMAVALTTTINTPFGALVAGRRSGVILNNEMDDFSTRPGKPNAFGLVQSEANAIAPGKRPLSSMSPTLVLKGGRTVLALGASGGPTIITATLQVLLNVLDFELELGEAVARSRIHHQGQPNELLVERDLPEDVRSALAYRGHHVKEVARPYTAVQAVQVREDPAAPPAPGATASRPRLLGAADPRKHGAPAGY
ncbi:MAG: gamma-glutamyltransferase [Deltaproteobacteria bacterium]|nr:gamma-glutamyltransferase [Deltaproteobacteria bacterium]